MRRFAILAVGALLATKSPGHARAADCPDGHWFCDPAPLPAEGPASPAGPAPATTGSGPAAPAEAPPGGEQATPGAGAEPSPPGAERGERRVRIDVERVRPAVRPRHRRFREWGVNMHATIGLIADDSAADDAGMSGVGPALRFRPIPHIAIEGSLELVWGVDYNGFERFEHALLASGLFFANPRSAVQLYGIAGFGVGGAYIDSSDESGLPLLRDETYSYVGAHLGIGLEARVTRHFALGADLIGFVRDRTDRNADENPEFIDPVTHRQTNSSGGGLVRLGATYYF